MGEYLKGIVASIAGVLLFLLDWLNVLNVDTLPKVIALLSGILAVLVPNVTRDPVTHRVRNVRSK